ncbi:MAG: HAMP domain-containing histidine kinase [Bacteroidetes bacterium]|nr:HAMP domain-containing histidine kinase [Bacteroidota bacterium]MBS1739393.1 HAMP domain-containing histidine kinase [Bacteroidota bacterium]MBS1775276.1 HAMP domain-containing histidine kinase [Bacteroidota bacterium]
MQIRYRITFAYSIIVTVILLMLCSSIYYFSIQNRTKQFYNRLHQKCVSTADLIWKYGIDPDMVQKINTSAPSALLNKGILILDEQDQVIFKFCDRPEDCISLPKKTIDQIRNKKKHLFSIGDRDVTGVVYPHQGINYLVITAAYDGDKADWIPKIRLILILSFFFSIAIVIVSGYFFSIGLVRSISDLTHKINQISSENFSRRLDTGNNKDELQQLGSTVNDLLDRLQQSFDIQRRFIDNASHELSTPLASIGSQIDVTLQRDRNKEEYRNVLLSIYDDTQRLNLLVRSLLEMAKVSGSVHGIELSPIRIDEVLMRIPAQMRKLNSAYDVRLSFGNLPDEEEALTVYGNEELLTSAIKNIIQNACKFSVDNTALVLLKQENEHLEIVVEDRGPGISENEQELIFRPFFRSAETNNFVSGSGLGLPLANQIIKLYGGYISVQSKIGFGSKFIINLPPTTTLNTIKNT